MCINTHRLCLGLCYQPHLQRLALKIAAFASRTCTFVSIRAISCKTAKITKEKNKTAPPAIEKVINEKPVLKRTKLAVTIKTNTRIQNIHA